MKSDETNTRSTLKHEVTHAAQGACLKLTAYVYKPQYHLIMQKKGSNRMGKSKIIAKYDTSD